MSAGIEHAYRYAQPSSLDDRRLQLATSAAPHDEGAEPFIEARVLQPRTVALTLRLVSDVVRSRHHVPAAMLERILLEADPVLTWGGDVLRVEGFSSCCGIYVRADVSAAALDPREARSGSTNVDFNGEMRAALGRIRDSDEIDLAVGSTGVEVTHDARGSSETVIERKVRLPLRWLRGLVEVQAIQRRMEQRFSVDRAAAVRFLRALPRSGRSSDAASVVASGRTIRLGSTARGRGVRVAGLARLRTLEPALPLARSMSVYEDPLTGASAWRLDCGAVTLTTVLSAETWRGFSGEGQVLSQLAGAEPKLARVRALLAWQSQLSDAAIAKEVGLEAKEAGAAMAWLATQGLVGYDISQQGWFHRVLPFDLQQTRRLIDARHPRLKGARALLEDDAVEITGQDEHVEARVRSKDVVHRVRIDLHGERCTCTWFAKHQGERGPCKHVLAVELLLARRRS